MTPIFTTYNPNLKKMIICFPYFSEFFSEWAADYKGDGSNCLPEILKDMIRDLLILMSKTSVRGLDDLSSYICIRAKLSSNNNNKYPNAGKREILKFIRFPLSGKDPNEHQMRTSFAALFRKNLPGEWFGRDFMLFTEMMGGVVYSLQVVTDHPVLKCGAGIVKLIRACFREDLRPRQIGILERVVDIAKYGGQSWHARLIHYPILLAMSRYRTESSDSYDLLWFARKATAHYKENLNAELRSGTIQRCPFNNIHPSFIVMTLYPGLVSDLYELYLNHEYLNVIV
ncbi:uncharacterized protein [Aegilops tauschii subsp. strangulata]|uniref:uncharacterized protein n=1 Tax=Aegilops tauschii subsp. strangulata TaxID=200361 RepID=UPI001E1CA12D|nr:uncharacterized protein LOC109766971 [Aegilops tauschii subsp. strangulata]